MVRLTAQQIQERFPPDTEVTVCYQNEPEKVKTVLKRVNWRKRVMRLTIMFGEPRCYLNDGDACYRPGFRVVVA